MSAPRLASFAIEHMAAEVMAFPFAAEAAAHRAVVELDPNLEGTTGELWRAAEPELLRQFPSLSVDELNNSRDWLWFEVGRGKTPLHALLRRSARRWLELRAGYAGPVLRRRGDGAAVRGRQLEARWFWRWLTFALPPDLFLAALDAPQRAVANVSEGVARQLNDGGYAQLHQHLGAALGFEDFWVAALHAVATTSDDSLASPGASLGGGEDLGRWLLRAALARHLLGAFLGGREGGQNLAQFVAASSRWSWGGVVDVVVTGLHELRTFHLQQEDAEVRRCYAQLTGVTAVVAPAYAADIQAYDPLVLTGSVARPAVGAPTPEMRLISLGLSYLESEPGGKDAAFAAAFWQVVRVRCLLYRYLVQRPLTPGLQWFVRFYDRIRRLRPASWRGRLQVDAALELDRSAQGLQSTEFRTAPDATSEILGLVEASEWVRAERNPLSLSQRCGANRAYRGDRPPPEPPAGVRWTLDEFRKWAQTDVVYRSNPGEPAPLELGVVLHFPKSRGAGADRGRFPAHWRGSNADPSLDLRDAPNSAGYRYQRYYLRQRQSALAFARALLDFPLSLAVLRGVDVCTDEQGVPTWVIAPFFRYVREAGCLASRWLREEHGINLPGLRATAHVGEDFIHLLGGLRRVDEAIRHYDLGEGDRLGHALALGVDPEYWARRAGQVAVPREERWFDLVWEWTCYSRGFDGNVSQQRSDFVDAEVERLSNEIFEQDVSPLEAAEAVKYLHLEEGLLACGFPLGPKPSRGDERRRGGSDLQFRRRNVVVDYLTSPDVFMRGRELEVIDTESEGAALRSLQDSLRRKVGRLGLVVEVNPSSNLLIGDLTELERHPIWRLDPPRGMQDLPPVSVCVGSDDPLTFATSLREEYQLLADSLMLAGLSEEEAMRWVDRVRQCGLRARFTLPLACPVDVRGILGPPPGEPRPMP